MSELLRIIEEVEDRTQVLLSRELETMLRLTIPLERKGE
jgi:hypothetical protein